MRTVCLCKVWNESRHKSTAAVAFPRVYDPLPAQHQQVQSFSSPKPKKSLACKHQLRNSRNTCNPEPTTVHC